LTEGKHGAIARRIRCGAIRRAAPALKTEWPVAACAAG